MKHFTKLGQSGDWASGGGESGLYGPAQGDGLGFGGSQGLPNTTNLPSGHTGDPGDHWSGNLVTDEPFLKIHDKATLREMSAEDLMKQIKTLLKINTPESLHLARSLGEALRDRMRRMKAARRFLQVKVAMEPWEILPRQKFEEDLPDDVYELYSKGWRHLMANRLDEASNLLLEIGKKFPNYKGHQAIQVFKGRLLEEIDRRARDIEKNAQTAQPIKGKCPESGKTMYMSQSDLVENDYKADCPEGKRRLEKMKSVSIKEYVKHKRKKKRKKKSELILMKTAQEQSLHPLNFTPAEQKIIEKVKEAAEALNVDAYLVGGFLRDRISGHDKEKEAAGDLDFMCSHDANKVVEYLAKKYGSPEPVEYSRSKAIMLNLDDQPIDFIDAKHVFHPLKVEGYSTLEEEEDETVAFDDAYRRDFTINSLMYDIRKGELIDPTGRGLQDLREGVINTIIDPFLKFRIHAPDMLRALRFAATLGFKLGPNMIEAMRDNANRVLPRDKGGDISNRRIRKELRKAIDVPEHWARLRELLQQAGLDIILAEDIQDVQDDFEGGIEYHLEEDEKSKLLEKQKAEKKATIMGLTKVAQEGRLQVNPNYYLSPLSIREPKTGYSLVWTDTERKLPDKVVGFVSLDPKVGAWRWEPMRSDYSYGKFPTPELAAEELIKQLPNISYRDSLPVFNATMSLRQLTKQSGIFDLFKKKEPELDIVRREEEARKKRMEELKKQPKPLSGIKPASKPELVRYLAQKIDERLPSFDPSAHPDFVVDFLAQYKISKSSPLYAEVLSLLRNYGKGARIFPDKPAKKDVEWRD